jgi:MYXO-CTERM domain-containing protein
MYLRAAAVSEPGGSPFFGLFFLLSVAWFFLIARRLFQLGRADSPLTRAEKVQS